MAKSENRARQRHALIDMKCLIHAVGDNIEPWISQGIAQYQRRFSLPFSLEIRSMATPKRHKDCAVKIQQELEAQWLMKNIKAGELWVLCDEQGHSYSSPQLAKRLESWRQQSSVLHFLLGGPDGFSPELKKKAQHSLSLSTLTLPHAMARLFLVETLYRSLTIINQHPYHR